MEGGLKPWREYIENILVAVFLALLVRSYILTGYKVPTGSMAPTLRPGDFIFAYKPPYGFKIPFSSKKLSLSAPKRGEIVVFTYPDQIRTSYVKRIIGLPGDLVSIENGVVNVNGIQFKYEELNEDINSELPRSDLQRAAREIAPEGQRQVLFLKNSPKKNFGPIVVPPGEVFLIGDNRDASDDSRYWGSVPIERIEGRVVLIWLSINWQTSSIRWDRILKAPQ